MANTCGVGSWIPNSMIRHATSTTPLGPFTPQEIVLAPYAHNPVPVRAPDGTYLIFKIGCGQAARPCVVLGNVSRTDHDPTWCDVLSCANGTTPRKPWPRSAGVPVGTDYPPLPTAGPRGVAPGLLNVCNCSTDAKGGVTPGGVESGGLLYAASPWGPWHDGGGLHQPGCRLGPGAGGARACPWPHNSMNNPAPVFEPDGTLAAMFRSWCSPSNRTHCEAAAPGFNETSIGIARAASWDAPLRGEPWNITATPLFDAQTEDPYVWIDRRGHYHALFHHCFWPKIPGAAGGHAFSADGVGWEYSTTAAYTGAIEQVDGTRVGANRERPHLLLDKGEPAYLYTAVIVANGTNSAGGSRDHSYTHVQPIRRSSALGEAEAEAAVAAAVVAVAG